MTSNNSTPHAGHQPGKPVGDQRALIAFSWAVVSLPLAYGLYNAVKAAMQLFTGNAAG